MPRLSSSGISTDMPIAAQAKASDPHSWSL
jgi:hypothetical protein